jgi:hypothetical protein
MDKRVVAGAVQCFLAGIGTMAAVFLWTLQSVSWIAGFAILLGAGAAVVHGLQLLKERTVKG